MVNDILPPLESYAFLHWKNNNRNFASQQFYSIAIQTGEITWRCFFIFDHYLAIYLTNPNVQYNFSCLTFEHSTDSTSASEQQTIKYLFAHNVFPMICLGNSKEVFRKLSGPKANSYLADLWKGLENKFGAAAEHNGLYLLKEANLGDNKRVFVINMPEPSLVPEAYLIGVAMKASKSLLSVEVKNVRYFTLELGRDYYSGLPEYHFCEWVGVVNPKHKNYGQLESPASTIFISKIKDIF